MAAVVDDQVVPERGARGGDDHPLGQVHHVVVVGEGLVRLEHRELGVVPGVDALVAEHPPDLEHPLQAADDQPLEVQLQGDAQVHVEVEGVVVGDEGARRRPALDALQHRALDLHEAAVGEVLADGADGGVPDPEDLPGPLVDLQVDVTLPVAGLDVGQPAVLVGGLDQRLAQQGDRLHGHRQLASPRRQHRALDAHPVAAVQLVERPVHSRAGLRGVDEQLDRPRPVAQGREGQAAVAAEQSEPARHADAVRRPRVGGQVGMFVADLLQRVVGRVAVGLLDAAVVVELLQPVLPVLAPRPGGHTGPPYATVRGAAPRPARCAV